MSDGGEHDGSGTTRTQADGRPRRPGRPAPVAALLEAARALFAEKGFAATGREEIAERAGVTRALCTTTSPPRPRSPPPWSRSSRASWWTSWWPPRWRVRACGTSCTAGAAPTWTPAPIPTMARILADAPAVLGIEACRALDAVACAPLLAEVFARAEEEGIAVPGDPEVAAALLLGFLNEAAGLIAAAPADRALRRRVGDTVDEFLTRLFG